MNTIIAENSQNPIVQMIISSIKQLDDLNRNMVINYFKTEMMTEKEKKESKSLKELSELNEFKNYSLKNSIAILETQGEGDIDVARAFLGNKSRSLLRNSRKIFYAAGVISEEREDGNNHLYNYEKLKKLKDYKRKYRSWKVLNELVQTDPTVRSELNKIKAGL